MGVTPLAQEVATGRKQTRRIGITHAIFTEDKSLITQFPFLNKAVFT